MLNLTPKRSLLVLLAIIAALVALPANAEPTIAGLDAAAAARVLRASGVRVLAIGLALAPDPPRVTGAQPATYPPAEKAAPRGAAAPKDVGTSKAEPRNEHHGCNPWRRDVVVIPPPGVTVTQGGPVYITSNDFPRRRHR